MAMYKYFKKTGFILSLLFLGIAASAQNNITQWGGAITVNPAFDVGSPQQLINGDLTDDAFWFSFSSPTIIVFQAVKAVVLSSYSISDYYYYSGSPSAWTLSGSNDGITWTLLDTQNPAGGLTQATQSYPLTGNTTAYSYYQWTITSATNGLGGEMDLSELQLFTFSPPPPPLLTGNAFSGTEAGLAWKITGGYDSSFLQRSIDNRNFTLVKAFASGVTSYTDQTLSPSTLFYYRVLVELPDGSFQTSDTAQVTTNNLSGQSSDITSDGGSLSVSADNVGTGEVSANLIDHVLTTKWLVFSAQDPSGQLSAVYKPTGSYVVTGYALTTGGDSPPRDPASWAFSGSNDSSTWITLDSQMNQLGNNTPRLTNFNYSLANPGTTPYKFYRILFTADNGATDGVAYQVSEWEIFGIDATSPAIPTGLTVTASTLTSLSLQWTQAATNPVSGSLLQRSNDGLNFLTIDTLAAGVTAFTDKNLYDSATYYYRIQALGGRSTAISGWSDVAKGTTSFIPGQPLIPGLLTTAFVIDSVVGLQWVNRSYNATGFRIERSTDGINFTAIDSVPAGITTFSDSTVWPAFRYYYRVAAFNAQSISAGYSNTDSVLTTGFNDPPIATQINPPQMMCSNTSGYSFNIGGLTAGTIGTERTQQLTVTRVSVDKAGFFSNLSYTPSVTNGVATFTIQGSGATPFGDTATVTVTVKDNGGTLNGGTDSVLIPVQLVYIPLNVTISADKDALSVPRYTTVQLTASTNYASTTPTYNWDPAPGIIGSSENIILDVEPMVATVYTVHATNTVGCTATAQITLTPVEGQLISNVLTPNGDGKNDTWIIWGITQNPNNSVKVFDRAGRLVFYKQNYSNDWGGTVNGKILDEGAYYYVVDYGDGKKPVTGMLTIIRDHK